MTEQATAPAVYTAIAAVAGKMAKEGISKSRTNNEQKYKFRGIDDVYNALAPLLSEHKLCILTRVLDRDLVERKTAKGNPLFSVTLKVEFDFVSAEDGSKHTITTYGEAMDTADKATNKAMSAAYKYACLQAFCIPTEGDNDADANTHEVAPQQQNKAPPAAETTEQKAERAAAMLEERITKCETVAQLDEQVKLNERALAGIKQHLPNRYDDLMQKVVTRKTELTQQDNDFGLPPVSPAGSLDDTLDRASRAVAG